MANLDPEPYVVPYTGFRRTIVGALGSAMRGTICDFEPRPEYSQNIEDYQ